MSSADERYMKCPRQTYFLVYTIPKDLRGHPRFMTANGKPMDKITESLGTKDPDKARENRNQRIAYWDKQFHILRHGPNEDDIREEAINVYRAARKAEGERIEWLDSIDFADEELARYPARLDEAIGKQVAAEITDFCQRAGVTLRPGTEPYRKIGIEFIRAKIAAGAFGAYLPLPDGRQILGEHQRMPEIEPPTPPEPKPVTAPPPPRKGAETFAEAAAIYLKNELRDGVKPATVAEYRRKVEAFPHKDKPLRTITRGMVADFLDGLQVTKRTRNLYAALLSAVYKSAIRREKASANPFEEQRLKGVAKVHYEPFTDEEIAALFADAKFEVSPEKHTTATALPWASLIAAYTGCRREEVAQLKAADIKQTDGIWYFEFCHDGNGKTEAATRVVPFHRALIDAGLLKYRDALPAGSRLFPGLKGRASKDGKLGAALGDAFEAWRKRLGIVRKGVNFHSFRHTVGDRLLKAGVPENDSAALLGHAHKNITTRVYGHSGPGLRRLREIVEKISYPGL
jgi:integrase